MADNYDEWKLSTPEEDNPYTGECKFCGSPCNINKDYCSSKCFNNDLND